jgi:hypothetical protein
MALGGDRQSCPFAFEPCGEGFRFYDLRNFHFEDSPEAFLKYLENRGDSELVSKCKYFLGKYELYPFWQRYTRIEMHHRPSLEETKRKGTNQVQVD